MGDYNKPDVIVYQDVKNKPDSVSKFNWSGFDPAAFIKAFSKKRSAEDAESELYDLLLEHSTGGSMGKSAYEIWLDAGNTGTVEDFLNSLIGPQGDAGASAYEIWLGLGNVGTQQDFITSLVGAEGKSAYDIWIEEGNSGSTQDFLDYLKNAASYTQQFTNESLVLVEHNLNRFPSVVVLDEDKNLVMTAVSHTDINNLQVKMTGPKSGYVFCN